LNLIENENRFLLLDKAIARQYNLGVRNNIFHPLSILVFLIVTAGWIWISTPSYDELARYQAESPAVGFLAPDFSLTTIDGKKVMLADLRGKAVLINFWASWCPPCRSEMPAIQNIFVENSSDRLMILAINATNVDSDTAAYKFVQENNLTFPVLFDRDGSVSNKYRANSLPTTFFIDQNGLIKDIVIGGPMTEAFLEIKVDELLRSLD
jgi:cytochrome c biogenesis protein CcmG, thiol:disulfide interchange protein DsbE